MSQVTSSRSINTQKKNLANIQPSWPHTWSITHTYTWVERGTVRVKWLAQEHDAMSPVRARTQTCWSGVEDTNHEMTSLPHGWLKLYLIVLKNFVYIFYLLCSKTWNSGLGLLFSKTRNSGIYSFQHFSISDIIITNTATNLDLVFDPGLCQSSH